MPSDRLSNTLKQLDYSDTVTFWLPSARWCNLPSPTGSSRSSRSKRSSCLGLVSVQVVQTVLESSESRSGHVFLQAVERLAVAL
jgi:hypothetical protein